jgi:hypothetical protein
MFRDLNEVLSRQWTWALQWCLSRTMDEVFKTRLVGLRAFSLTSRLLL